ncbi:MAG TPA: serine protease [Candidatus Sumerlaeota bacterium]|nr:serine protease [Candidatus Sumerlaeota bacterium]
MKNMEPAPILIEESLKDSIVKIYTVFNRPDNYRPWQMAGQRSSTGSGCIIEGKRILTNAHVVADQTFIQVMRAGEAEKYVARLETVAHDCDLALLRVDDESFFEGAEPIPLGQLPCIQDKVAVYGFPQGGTKLAITEGVVSRVEHLTYAHSEADLLCCQIDAAINPGSSGGPVISNHRIVGVAFQGCETGQNIGYMVPAPIIERFLHDIHHGRYGGVPALGLSCQCMENRAIRKKFGMPPGASGILVNQVDPKSSAQGVIQADDILVSVDGMHVANDGTVEFRKGERTSFLYAVHRHFIGDRIPMEILRGGQPLKVEVELSLKWENMYLVPRHQYEKMPSYYIIGGLVFSPITANLLAEWETFEDAPRKLVHYYDKDPEPGRDEVITLIQVLAHEVNVGYEELYYTIINTINGVKVRDMRHLVSLFEEAEGDYYTIQNEDGVRIVLSRKMVGATNHEILDCYRIPADRSEDLKTPAQSD